jgi:hypothetical protein
LDRVAASVGILHGADIEFELVEDVPDGGVLLALPSLFLLGLLSKSPEILLTPEGFYPLKSIFLLLALYRLRPRRLLAAILREMKEQRIAVLTYHKFPGELWPEQEFRSHQLVLLICNTGLQAIFMFIEMFR